MAVKRKNIKIAVIDAETDPFKYDPDGYTPKDFIWGFYDGERYEEFTHLNDCPNPKLVKGMRDTSELVPFLSEQTLIVYAHNGGKFDYHLHFSSFIEPFSPIMEIAGRLAKFKIGECEFRDSFNILPVPLKQFQKDDIDYEIMRREERYKPANWKKIRSYLHTDCVALYNFIMAFIDRFGVQLTQAGASMKYWQEMTGIKAPQSTAEYYDELKPYYYGGRVQCFQRGMIYENFKVADINSAYPRAMLDKHPFDLTFTTGKELPENRESIGPCLITVRAISLGAFPLRDEKGSLTFPNDISIPRIYHVTGWEYLAAIDTGTAEILNIIKVYQFDTLIDFRDYILPLYNERLEAKRSGDKATNILTKLAMNSLYGKFASNPEKYRELQLIPAEYATAIEKGICDEEKDEDEQLDDDKTPWQFGGYWHEWALAQRPVPDYKQRFYNVATAASITGWVRAYLWRAICKCEGVLYCDTDSIAACHIGNIDIGDELGQWDIEGEFIQGAIAGKKMYAFKYADHEKREKQNKPIYKIASKGVRLQPAQIEKVARGGTVEYFPDVPTYSLRKPEPVYVPRKIRATK